MLRQFLPAPRICMIDYRTQAPQILRDFLSYHETIKAHSRRTVDEYFLDLRNFFRYLKQVRDPSLADLALDEIDIMDVDLGHLPPQMPLISGSLAEVTSSVIHHGEEQGIELQCADAKLSAPWDVKAEIGQANGFWKPGGNQELVKRLNDFYESLPDLKYEGHTGEIDDVLSRQEEALEQKIMYQMNLLKKLEERMI